MKSLSNTLTRGGAAGAPWAWILVALLAMGCSLNDPPQAGEEKAGAGVSTAMYADSCCSPSDLLACQDGRWCTGVEGCDCWGNCEVGVPVNCNDGDPCTNDYCVDDRIDPPATGYGDGHCEHICIPGPTCVCPECLWPSDCDDGDACTVDDCDAFGQCIYMDLDCNDHNVCTDDSCDALLGCVNTPIPGCCSTNADCNDGILCTTDTCNFATHECVNQLVAGYCLIGGVCYTNGTVNPANVCESCQYLLQNDRWSGLPAGTACDDGEFCTADSVCDGDGNCVGAGNPCNDGLECTDDACNEATDSCIFTVRDTWCLIGGVCWVDYDINPANECQRCLSTSSKTAWSGVPAGTTCDDGLFCTDVDECNGAGSCVGTGNPCDDGIGCTDNACNEATDSCSYPVSANRCYIDSVCYTHHDWNPANDCQWCDSTLLVNRTVWTNRPAGAACPNGLFCDGAETCDGAGTCMDRVDPCIDPYTCTTDICDEPTDTCSYPIDPGWCLISSVCYAESADNPANECQLCETATSNTSWTNKPAATPCDDLLFCTGIDACDGAGNCVGPGNPCDDGHDCTTNQCNEATNNCSYPINAGLCLIAGVCYASGDWNPLNDCQWCDPASSQTAWTNRPAGADCSNGLFCDGAETCDGLGVCQDNADPCVDGIACTDDICDEGTDTCSNPVSAGQCHISGVCYGDGNDNPANPCQLCDAASSQIAWTNKPAGASCDDLLYCTGIDTCDGAGTCLHPGNPCDDGNTCTTNQCNEGTDDCSYPVNPGTCLISGACYIEGELNSSNICQACVTATSQTDWTNLPSGTACSNGDFCDGAETCDGLGVCQDNADPCIDGLACTTDTCDEGTDTCSYPIIAGYCLIGGVCYDNLTINAANECQYCLSATSNTTWTNRPAGASCDDLLYCTGVDTCDGAGVCQHPGNPCDDGNTCTTNSCNEATDTCSYPINPGTCLIGGTCYNNGDLNPVNNCQWCDTATINTDWTNRPLGADCSNGLYCDGAETCNGGGLCQDNADPCVDGIACTDDLCDEGTDSCTNPITAGWCYIGAACYADGEDNLLNLCQLCDTVTSQTVWTNKAPGASCDDSLYCTGVDTCDGFGVCQNAGNPCDDGFECTINQCNEASDDCSYPISTGHCLIDLICYHNGDLNPANPCQSCDRPVSRTSWTNLPSGTACSNGDFCDGAETCDGAGVCQDNADPCVDGIDCTDDNCDEGTNSCANPVTVGWCYIDSTCYADMEDNPLNVCQRCDDSASQVVWTNKPDGQYIGCDATVDECNYSSCVSGTCQVVADTGAACDYSAVDVCQDPGLCLADGTCGPGPWVYPPNDQCSGSINIGLASGDGSASGTTLCAADDYAGSCGGDTGMDVVYNFDFTVPSDFQLYSTNVVLSAVFDSVLYLRTSCASDPGSVRCNDNCSSNAVLDCATYGLDAFDSAIQIKPQPIGTSRNYSVIVDGYNAAALGDFTVTVDRVASPNNPCDSAAADARIPDATAGGVFRGNITGYTNDIFCDTVGMGNKCDCLTGWNCGAQLAATDTFPARAWFRLNPTATTTYCIYTDETVSANAFDSVVDVWQTPGTCTGAVTYVGCDHGSGSDPAAYQFTATGGLSYDFGVSTYCNDTVGTDYEVHVVPNPSSCP